MKDVHRRQVVRDDVYLGHALRDQADMREVLPVSFSRMIVDLHCPRGLKASLLKAEAKSADSREQSTAS